MTAMLGSGRSVRERDNSSACERPAAGGGRAHIKSDPRCKIKGSAREGHARARARVADLTAAPAAARAARDDKPPPPCLRAAFHGDVKERSPPMINIDKHVKAGMHIFFYVALAPGIRALPFAGQPRWSLRKGAGKGCARGGPPGHAVAASADTGELDENSSAPSRWFR